VKAIPPDGAEPPKFPDSYYPPAAEADPWWTPEPPDVPQTRWCGHGDGLQGCCRACGGCYSCDACWCGED
jgi:hypothetical protein